MQRPGSSGALCYFEVNHGRVMMLVADGPAPAASSPWEVGKAARQKAGSAGERRDIGRAWSPAEDKHTRVARRIMGREIPTQLIETLMNLGRENKETVKSNDQLVDASGSLKESNGEYGIASWEEACASLSRDEHILLFRGLIYADILTWGQSLAAPVNAVFSQLNKRCWPDTVYQVIGWAMNACEYHEFDTGQYLFAGMLANRR
jgi:hypothetical protein